MFDDIKRGDEIKGVVVVWQLLCSSRLHRIQTTFAAKVDCLWRDVDAFCSPVCCEHLEVRSGAAANVENARIWSVKAGADFFYQRVNDLASSDIPPVSFLHFIEDR